MHRGDEPRESPTEDRVSLGRRQEIAGSARSWQLGAVIAAFGVVEGDLHEPRECDRAVLADLVADLLHEHRIRCVVRRETPNASQVHVRRPRAGRAAVRNASRSPGPTRL